MTIYSKENALKDSPETSKNWKKLTKHEKVILLNKIINFDTDYFGKIEVVDANDDGHVIIKIEKNLKVSERGIKLLEMESLLKSKIDRGITIWLEPVGDKSKLRNLRGITFKSI